MRSEEVAARALKLVGDDRYKLALAVAKRAEALAGGAKRLRHRARRARSDL